MTPKVVVIGGSGSIGSKVVEKLQRRGIDPVAAPPNTGVYTVTGEGSDGGLAGAEVVVDVANAPSFDEEAAWKFFEIVGENLAAAEVADAVNFFYTAFENLAAAEVAAGVKHHVLLSVVGTERLQDGAYFRAKLAQENAIKGSPIPYTIIRATPVFESISFIAEFGTVRGTVRVSHSLFQPIAADDVANMVAEVALQPPRNGTLEIAGPELFYIDELVARVLERHKDPRNIALQDPGGLYCGVKVDDQSLMPGPNAWLGSTTFDWWLSHTTQLD